MNLKVIVNLLGRAAILLALLFLFPIAVALIYGEMSTVWAFGTTALASGVAGFLLTAASRTQDKVIYAKEGFTIVSLVWLLMAAVGAVPFVITGEIPNYIDAFFETVSGFTTTGASILTDVEALSHGSLFWRSFTHWLGGMGVLVFIMAVVPNISDRSIHIMRAEMPGPIVGKLVPRIKDTAKILYLIYIGMTLTETVLLLCGEMNLFESLVHALGTAGTGGFGIKATSLGGYSAYSQWVITAFMLLFGVNFNLYYLIFAKKIRTALQSREMRCYFIVVLVVIAIVTFNIRSMYETLGETVRVSSFQVASIVTTTGYSTVDFNAWPTLSKALLVLLMFAGGCAGSTAGGLKFSRVMLLFKLIGREFKKALHPNVVKTVKWEGKSIDEGTLSSVSNYFALYMICLLTTFLLISIEPQFGFETNMTAAISCFNNIGPGLDVVGPAGSYAAYNGFSKLVLSFAMLAGRLEIYPLLLAALAGFRSKR